MLEWITDYIKFVKSNPKRFCKKIKRLVYLVEKLLERKDIEFKPSDPKAFVKFAKMFKHREGHWAGKPLELDREQLFISACILGIKQYSKKYKMWLRYFRELDLFVARKWGKTLFISALGLFLLGFDKEPGAFGEILAENEKQSKKLYNLIAKNADRPEFVGIFQENKTEKYLTCTLNDGRLEYLSGRKKGKQGSNPSFFINDEANEITNKGQYSDKKQGMGARLQPLAIVISSAGITPESLYEMLYERNSKILGKSRFSDKERIFPVMFEIDPEDEVNNEKCWIKANPSMDQDRPSLNYLQQLYETSKDDPLELLKFTAYNLNRQIGAGMTYFDMIEIKNAMTTIKTEEIYDTYAVAGVDLSETTDLTNATATVLKENKLITLQAYFIAEERLERNSKKDNMLYKLFTDCKSDCEAVRKLLIITPGSVVDYKYVTNWFKYLRDEMQVTFLKIGYDIAMANYWVKDMQENGFTHEQVKFDKETRIEERDDGQLTIVRQGELTLSSAIKFTKSLFEDGKLVYDKTNKLLPYCFSNLKLTASSNNTFKPNKAKSTGRIDGVAGLFDAIVAYDRAKQIYLDSTIGDLFNL